MSAGLATALALSLLAIAALVGHLLAERRRLRRNLERAAAELQHLQTSFARFAPGAVVEGIVAGGSTGEASRREVTVMFADLVSFSALSEALTPEVLVTVLNEYFVRMSRVIGAHRGHV